MSRRCFQITTIYNYDTEYEWRETVIDTARTAREMLKRRGVHLGRDERAKAEKKYYSESGAWILYRRCSSLPDDTES